MHGILRVNVEERPTVEAVLGHAWMRSATDAHGTDATAGAAGTPSPSPSPCGMPPAPAEATLELELDWAGGSTRGSDEGGGCMAMAAGSGGASPCRCSSLCRRAADC